MKTLTARSLTDLPAIASALLQTAGEKKVLLFEGEMGAGKTTLIKEICKQLQVVSPLSSPTFSIVNEYITSEKKKVFHFDLYRIKKPQELADIGFNDYLYSGQYCFIEWPHQVEYDYPENVLKVLLRVEGDNRIIEVK